MSKSEKKAIKQKKVILLKVITGILCIFVTKIMYQRIIIMDNTNMQKPQELSVSDLEQRLLEMRGMADMSAEECRRLADDTIARYIDKAEELGLSGIRGEMQELSVKYGYPEEYKELKRLIQETEASCNLVFETFRVPICGILDSLGIEYTFDYRMKSVFSIWRKMHKDGKVFDEVYDLFATRIVYKVPETVKPLEHVGLAEYKLDPAPLPLEIFDPEILICWRIYTAITAIYRVQPDRIKDWVTHPKPSGYQCLQMTCMGPDCNWIEIQIRSERMHENAEYGSAAHWRYKKSGE